jgi:hypothetical protein
MLGFFVILCSNIKSYYPKGLEKISTTNTTQQMWSNASFVLGEPMMGFQRIGTSIIVFFAYLALLGY